MPNKICNELKKNEIFFKMIFNAQLNYTRSRADRLLCLWVSKKENAEKLYTKTICLFMKSILNKAVEITRRLHTFENFERLILE